MKALVITPDQWKEVLAAIKKDYAPSVWLSREKMRRVLGFTPREHTDWLGYGYGTTIHLDFFNESQRSMFLLRYGDRFGNKIENG